MFSDDGVGYVAEGVLSKVSSEDAQSQSLVQSLRLDFASSWVAKVFFNAKFPVMASNDESCCLASLSGLDKT